MNELHRMQRRVARAEIQFQCARIVRAAQDQFQRELIRRLANAISIASSRREYENAFGFSHSSYDNKPSITSRCPTFSRAKPRDNVGISKQKRHSRCRAFHSKLSKV